MSRAITGGVLRQIGERRREESEKQTDARAKKRAKEEREEERERDERRARKRAGLEREGGERDAGKAEKMREKRKEAERSERDARKTREAKKEKNRRKREAKDEKDEIVATRCLKLRIFPDKDQRGVLMLWLDVVRWSYNRGAEYVNATKDWGLSEIRKAMCTKESDWVENAPERMKGAIPYEIRDSAARDVHKACAALKAKEKRFDRKLKFKRKKDPRTSATLRSRQLNCKGGGTVWSMLFGTVHDRSAMRTEKGKTLPSTFEHDCRLVYDRVLGSFWLCVPTEEKKGGMRPDTQGHASDPPLVDGGGGVANRSNERTIVSIDPGVKTFATCYDPRDGSIRKWGDRPYLLGWLSRKCDRLVAKAQRHHGRSRRRILRVAARIRRRMTDLVSELHRQLSLWLCRNFSVILLPRFSARGCCRRKNLPAGKRRGISKKTTRRMMQLGHYRFRISLGHKCEQFGSELVVCSEAYTSMTCGGCGWLNRKLTVRDRVFVCPKCGWTADRDANGARNVLLRYMAMEGVDARDADEDHVGDEASYTAGGQLYALNGIFDGSPPVTHI